MRIQTRLFLGTAMLVLALMAVQWWLHVRQLRAIEHELGSVAAMVGRDLLSHTIAFIAAPESEEDTGGHARVWVAAKEMNENSPATSEEGVREQSTSDVHVMDLPNGAPGHVAQRIERIVRVDEDGEPEETVEHTITVDLGDLEGCADDELVVEADGSIVAPSGESVGTFHMDAIDGHEVELKVVRQRSPSERFLVVRDGAGERRIQIPVSPTQQIVRGTLQKSLVMSGGLLLLGLAGSGLLASRMTKPLRQLADTSEAVGRGELGVQVPENAAGEVGELQRSFNRMSLRLAELESEREDWTRREHLAQLGDLSRGLAHTVRNPLNTLGLAVEELAGEDSEHEHLVATARHQIRRIDRWMRSFLALGAGDAASAEPTDLAVLTEEVVLEAIQEGAMVELEVAQGDLSINGVPTAIRSALANLVQNAVDASPKSTAVEVSLFRDGAETVVAVGDRGQGLPEEVRQHLYSPHVTTKVGGSGMGLFLARQLIVGMHGGRLTVTDREEGGTLAEVRFPAAETDV